MILDHKFFFLIVLFSGLGTKLLVNKYSLFWFTTKLYKIEEICFLKIL